MNANEIRSIFPGEFEKDHAMFACAMLQEIAAQLADLNELLNSGKNGQANVLVWPAESFK